MNIKDILIKLKKLSNPDKIKFKEEKFGITSNNLLGIYHKDLKELAKEERVVVLYESPHRILKTLKDINEYFGDRYVIIVREITKMYEEIIRGKTSELIERLEENPIKGEIVLLIKEQEMTKKKEKVNKYPRD